MKIDDMKKVTQKLMQDMEQKIYIQQGSMFVSNGSSTPVQIYRTVTGPTSSSNTQIFLGDIPRCINSSLKLST